ncbi:Uncharacterised protein [Staphylococcus aureus]|nr:Uncharacterised protein [Staphylococcus aureus]
MPKLNADFALSTAISASPCESSSGLIAQSPKMYCTSPLIIKKIPDVLDTPGFVLMICKAGRTVSPVECAAPLTKPSALPA